MEFSLWKQFKPISLKQMEKVKFFNRIDRKFCLPKELLYEILSDIKDYYYVLDVLGNEVQLYHTIYYDTYDNYMYLAHHSGKLNLYKIRKRSYLLSNITFLEIKFKNNKRRTIKKRMITLNKNSSLNDMERQFISRYTPFNPEIIRPVMKNQFKRITIVNYLFNERCTIDLDLTFFSPENVKNFSNIAIIEIKTDGKLKFSPLYNALKKHHILETGFSKYCIGRALLEKSLKHNNFKIKLRNLEKFSNMNTLVTSHYAIGG